jgi:hypothetical protein
MQADGFFGSLFDYSFSSFITSRIIKVLYALTTVVVALWTLTIVLLAFRSSTGLGLVALLVAGPIFFLIMMIYVRVALELLMAIHRIHEHVDEINQRGRGGAVVVASASPPPETALAPAVTAPTAQPAPETMPVVVSASVADPAPVSPPLARFCQNCGEERRPGKGFCTACGEPVD